MKNSTATKNSIRYINDKQAQVTKAFMKKAQIFGTEEFKLWREYKVIYPDAVMVPKTITKKANKNNTTKNMTYENMKLYILNQEDTQKVEKDLSEFAREIQLSKVKANPYRAVLAWFKQKYGNVNDYMDYFAEEAKKEKEENEANLRKMTQSLNANVDLSKSIAQIVA